MATDWQILKTEYLSTAISLRALAQKHGISPYALQKVATEHDWVMERRRRRKAEKQKAMTNGAQVLQHKVQGTKSRRSAATKRISAPTEAAGNAQTHAAAATETEAVPTQQTPDKDFPKASTDLLASARMLLKESKTMPEGERLAVLRAIGDRLTDQLAAATAELNKQVVKHKCRKRELEYDGMEARSKLVLDNMDERCELEIVDGIISREGLQKLSATLKILSDVTKAGDGDAQSVGMVAELMKKLDAEAAREDG